LNTAVATQTLSQVNFLRESACWTIGTHCALEYTPLTMSTFSWSMRRVISLIATSTFDCASTKIGTIL
jgi:hypothetical protein